MEINDAIRAAEQLRRRIDVGLAQLAEAKQVGRWTADAERSAAAMRRAHVALLSRGELRVDMALALEAWIRSQRDDRDLVLGVDWHAKMVSDCIAEIDSEMAARVKVTTIATALRALTNRGGRDRPAAVKWEAALRAVLREAGLLREPRSQKQAKRRAKKRSRKL